jgi:hypothetical protein
MKKGKSPHLTNFSSMTFDWDSVYLLRSGSALIFKKKRPIHDPIWLVWVDLLLISPFAPASRLAAGWSK